MLGTAIGICTAIALERPTAPTARRLLWIAATLGLLAAAAPLASAALDYRARARLFPVLLDPDAPRGLAFVTSFGETVAREPLPPQLRAVPRGDPAAGRSNAAAVVPASGAGVIVRDGATPPPEHALRVALDRGPWPGITLEEPAPDWRGWRALVVEVANPGDQPLTLFVRVNDRAHDNRHEDRYNEYLALPPRTRRRFEFPLEAIEHAPAGRRMDLTQIEKLIVFHGGPAPGRSFYLERLALVR